MMKMEMKKVKPLQHSKTMKRVLQNHVKFEENG